MADDGLVNELLAKNLALVRPLETLLDDRSRHAKTAACWELSAQSLDIGGLRIRLTNHHPSLVVEVAKDDVDALVLLTKQVLYWDLDIFECHVGRASGGRVGCLDGLGLDALSALDEDDAQALVGSNTRHEVICPTAVGDPLLCSVDNLSCVRYI